jgi:hypothetical protein
MKSMQRSNRVRRTLRLLPGDGATRQAKWTVSLIAKKVDDTRPCPIKTGSWHDFKVLAIQHLRQLLQSYADPAHVRAQRGHRSKPRQSYGPSRGCPILFTQVNGK